MTNERGLSAALQAHGCPMMDDTFWVQSPSGEVFECIDGIRTVASWLPCVSSSEGLILPGTCASCVVHHREYLTSDGRSSSAGP
jgi:hypothetical protein